VDVCGNAAAVLGDSSAGCVGGATVGGTTVGGHAAGRPVVEHDSVLLSKGQLAELGILPGVGSLPAVAGLASLPVLHSLAGGALLPVSHLSAFQGTAAPGMSSNSFATLATGALLAGAAALKLASRRPRSRKTSLGRVAS
jgi:hypothetical protein